MRPATPSGSRGRSRRCASALAALALTLGCGGGADGAPRPTCLPLEPPTGASSNPAARLSDARYRAFDPRAEDVSGYVTRRIAERGGPFDWNLADPSALCAASAAKSRPLVVGVTGSTTGERHRGLDRLEVELGRAFGGAVRIERRNDRLGTLRLALGSCAQLGVLRGLDGVGFVEVEPALDARAEVRGYASVVGTALAAPSLDALPTLNPGLYEPGDPRYPSYADFIAKIDPDSAAWIRGQHMDRVHDELGLFGSPAVGVAVLDNGVLPEWVDYLSTGGAYRTAGYHPPDLGQTHPQDGDFFGLSKIIPNTFDHGTRQSRYIQCFAPRANRATVRGASLPYLLLSDDLTGATNGLLALADDDGVQVISMSMGTIFRSQEMERAIDEVHARGKILVAAAGTSIPVVRDIIGVVFPATLPTVISATGLSDTTQTGGRFVLGSASHGGPENDFAVEPSPASSEAVSSLAGIIAALWSIDPTQPPESIVDALIRSSNFYQASGAKDPLLGWGRVDAYEAALTIRDGGCQVGQR